MIEADMHVHSCYSDGYDNPEELLVKAKQKKLKAICLVDHDAYQGLSEFNRIVSKFDIETIPGIEITTHFKNIEVHILGYGISYSDTKLLDHYLQTHWNIRNKYAENILEKYTKLNIMNLTQKDFTSLTRRKGPFVSPLQIRLVRSQKSRIPFADTKREVNRNGIAWNKMNYELFMTPDKAIHFILSIGKLAVLAHPGKFCRDALRRSKRGLHDFFDLIDLLQGQGMQGLEVYCPRHTQEQTHLFNRLAKERRLLPTGGSDSHGFYDNFDYLGQIGISYKDFSIIKEICL